MNHVLPTHRVYRVMDRPEDRTRAERIRRLFDEVVDLAPEARALRLREAEREDADVCQAVAALLSADEGAEALLDSYRHQVQGYREAVLGEGPMGAELVGQTVAHYIVLERLGGGGMGDVFKAWDTRLDRTVALKFLRPYLNAHDEAKQRFVQEAKAASVLDHPNLCTIYEIGESSTRRLFIAMPCYGGETLGEKIARGPLPVDKAVRYVTQMAEGLQRAHEAGLVHRDVKPANVMVTEHEHVKVLDFGIAKIADTNQTRPGARIGTVAYMSPEHARGEPARPQMDVWSLGVVLYEMLTGTRPFQGTHEASLLLAIQREDPVPLRARRAEVPEPLARIVTRALQKDLSDRYASMQALLDDLQRLADTSTPAALAAPRDAALARMPGRPFRRRPALLGLAGGLAVLAGLAGWWASGLGLKAPAAPQEHAIAVMYFENLTGDPALAWIEAGMVEMLTSSLGQFDKVEILSSQRLFDIMRQVSRGEATQVDRTTATEIARRAGVRTMILGSVLGEQDHLRLNTQLVDVATGDLVGTEVVEARPNGSLFALVDSLTWRLAARLEIVPATRPSGSHVAYTLTHSPEALRHYVEGLQAMYRSNFSEALSRFDAAVATDSSFAMAYYHRELAYSWQTGSADREALERALRFGQHLSDRERALIEATFTMLEDLPTRKQAFERLTQRYGDEKFAWYQLGEILYHNYWPRASVKVFERSADLDPHFLIAYLHLADFFFHTDAYEAARPVLDAVLSLDSANVEFQLNEAFLDVVGGDAQARARLVRLLERVAADTTLSPFSTLDAKAALAMMTKEFEPLVAALAAFRGGGYYGDEGYVLATNSLAGLALLRGDLTAAERFLDEARQRHPASPSQLYEEGLFRLLRGQPRAARANGQTILRLYDDGTEPFTEVAALGRHLLFLAHLDEGNLASAREAVSALGDLMDDFQTEYRFLHADALGRLACHQGDTDAALRHFEAESTATSFTGTQTGVVLLFNKLLLDAHLACLEQAGAYETLLQHADEAPLFVYHFHDFNASTIRVWLRTLLRKARAYEALGRTRQAVAAYEDFLSFWHDPALPGVRAAQARRARLTQ